MVQSQINSDKLAKVSALQAAVAGAASGALTRAIAQPLDVLKIRFQLQFEPIKHGSKYSSMLQATSSILKEEGLFTLWSGHIPAQYLSISYGFIQFATFEKLVQFTQQTNVDLFQHHTHSINFVSGALAATVATIVSFPFDTIRTRLIAEQKTNKVYNGFTNAFSIMVKREGFVSLFKGLVPTLGQIAPHAGIQFVIYKLFTDNILRKLSIFHRKHDADTELTMLANLLAGSIAGLVAKTAIYPFDLVKKRLQIQGFQKHRTAFGRQIYCHGVLHCLSLTVKEEGFKALYKGYLPSIVKAVLMSSLHFAFYDEIKHFLLHL